MGRREQKGKSRWRLCGCGEKIEDPDSLQCVRCEERFSRRDSQSPTRFNVSTGQWNGPVNNKNRR